MPPTLTSYLQRVPELAAISKQAILSISSVNMSNFGFMAWLVAWVVVLLSTNSAFSQDQPTDPDRIQKLAASGWDSFEDQFSTVTTVDYSRVESYSNLSSEQKQRLGGKDSTKFFSLKKRAAGNSIVESRTEGIPGRNRRFVIGSNQKYHFELSSDSPGTADAWTISNIGLGANVTNESVFSFAGINPFGRECFSEFLLDQSVSLEEEWYWGNGNHNNIVFCKFKFMQTEAVKKKYPGLSSMVGGLLGFDSTMYFVPVVGETEFMEEFGGQKGKYTWSYGTHDGILFLDTVVIGFARDGVDVSTKGSTKIGTTLIEESEFYLEKYGLTSPPSTQQQTRYLEFTAIVVSILVVIAILIRFLSKRRS